MGQFERTLIIADEGSYVHYVEDGSAPIYSSDSLHSASVEFVAKRAPASGYTTIQTVGRAYDTSARTALRDQCT